MLKKFAVCTLILGMVTTGNFASVYAEESAETSLTPGVTVTEDEESPTGYSVTITYENADASQVTLNGSFQFYKNEEGVLATTPEDAYSPEEWEDGMFVAGDEAYAVDMTKVEGTDLWTVSMPLPSGNYEYVFHVDGAEDSITDPANPAEADGYGNEYNRSTFYVPYNEEKQPLSTDYSYLQERNDEQKGTVDYVTYKDINGEDAVMGVYLPYGYDESREEAYPVLILSHGMGGCETDWFAAGCADTIFDNMIAEGSMKPTILVSLNNGVYQKEEGGWDYDLIAQNVAEYALPYVIDNYHVSEKAEDHAYVGLSAGSIAGTNVYYNYADKFGYFGLFSAADGTKDLSTMDKEMLASPKLMLGAGVYDSALTGEAFNGPEYKSMYMRDKLDDEKIPYTFQIVQGSHDWFTWPQLLKTFAEYTLWK